MARIRSIKPDFWTDEKVVELSAFARLLFIGLWNFADDEGRMVYSEKKIKMQIFPSDSIDISGLFGEIRGEKMIDVYSIDNVEYLQIVGFSKHQKIDKRTPSKLPSSSPPPPESPRIPTTDMEGKGKEEDRKYRFAGLLIRLTEKDYLDFRKTYHAILDFDAELKAADMHYSKSGNKDWFFALGGWLNNSHQKNLAKIPTQKPREIRSGAITL